MERKGTSLPGGKAMNEKEALRRAAGLCSRKEQYTGYIRDKLKEWNQSEEATERIIRSLEKELFLDDRRYAAAFVRDKFKLNTWGKIKISHMLRMKGVDGEIIREALEEIDQQLYEQACAELIRARSAGLKDKNPYARKAKLYRFASGRGFEPDLIYKLLRMEEEGG